METKLDEVDRLVACRQLERADVVARRRLGALVENPAADRLATARATRVLADVLLQQDDATDTATHVFEARRRYRPYRSDPRLAGEVDLVLATFAYQDDRSGDGEQILGDVVASTEKVPDAQLVHARALRYACHLEMMRLDFARADELMTRALVATELRDGEGGSALVERYLLRSQYLFSAGEVAFFVKEPSRSFELTHAALDFVETRFGAEPEYQQFARGRAAHAFRILGDEALAAQVEAGQTRRT